MEAVKVKDVVTEYRSYEWSGYTPLGMIMKAKQFVYFGRTISVTYINFGKRR